VTNGLFTVVLDFGGDVFDGGARYLEIALRPLGSANPYVPIAPRQSITPTPYALHALDSAIPPGSIMAYMGTNAPAGWLLCDGSAVSRGTYARLFTAIGVASGSGDGFSTFNLPDLRGTFLRGMDGTAGVDPDKASRVAAKPGGNSGNALGSLQTDQFKSHNHANGNFSRVLQLTTGGANTASSGDATPGEPDLLNSASMVTVGGNETRPRNIYVNYIIKH
jgi:microcystin-dependent protein